MTNDVNEPAIYIKLQDKGCKLYYFFKPVSKEISL